MGWQISKQFNCCYGHRVYTQTTNEEFALNRPAKCRHIHGHEGLIEVHLVADELNEEAMVTDFCNLGWLKKFIDDNIDHKFIFGEEDPFFSRLLLDDKNSLDDVMLPGVPGYVVGQVFNLDQYKNEHSSDYEIAEGYFVVDFVPTSENLSKWMYELVSAKMAKLGVTVSKIVWWETPKSKSEYYGEYVSLT